MLCVRSNHHTTCAFIAAIDDELLPPCKRKHSLLTRATELLARSMRLHVKIINESSAWYICSMNKHVERSCYASAVAASFLLLDRRAAFALLRACCPQAQTQLPPQARFSHCEARRGEGGGVRRS